jgi:membrane-associated phospholipid phosphatase
VEGPVTARTLDLDALAYPTRRLAVILLGATAVFIALAVLVGISPHDVPAFDQVIFEWVDSHNYAWLDSTLRQLGRAGATEVVIPVGLAVSALVAVKLRSWSPLVMFSISYCLAAFVTLRVKVILDRPEPYDLPGDQGQSYPSGHLSQSTSVYVLLFAFAVAFRYRTAIRAVIVTVMTIIWIAVTYRAAHFLTDVIGGAALGVMTATIAILCVRAVERLPLTRSILSALRSRPITQPRGSPESDVGDAGRQADRSGAGR